MEDNLPILPQEISQQVIYFCDHETKLTLRLTSTKMFKLVNYTDFTIYWPTAKTLRSFLSRQSNLSKYSSLIGLSLISPRKIPTEELFRVSILTNLSSLRIDNMETSIRPTSHFWFKLTTLTNLQHLQIVIFPDELKASFHNLTRLCIGDRFNYSILTTLTNIRDLSIIAHKRILDPQMLNFIQRPSILTSLFIFGDEPSAIYTEDQMSKFSNLKRLTSSGQTLPYQVLTRLEFLRLDQELDSIDSLTNLTTLELDQAFFQWPADQVQKAIKKLSSLVRLKELTISLVVPTIDFEILRALTALELLNLGLGSVRPENLQQIGSTRLKHLHARFAQLQRSHISHLTCLSSLEIEVLTNRDFLLEAIQDLTNLTSLNAPINYAVANFEYLTSFKSLKTLSGFNMAPDALNFLGTNIEALTFNIPKDYIDNSYESLTRFETLSHLEVQKSGNAIWSTLSKLTTLSYLSINKAKPDKDIESLTSLTRLVHLTVSGPVTSAPFTKLTSLKYLYVKQSPTFSLNDLRDMPHLRNKYK